MRVLNFYIWVAFGWFARLTSQKQAFQVSAFAPFDAAKLLTNWLRQTFQSFPHPQFFSKSKKNKKFSHFFNLPVDIKCYFLYLMYTSFLERYQSGRTGAVLKTVDLHGSGGSNPSRSDSWRCGRAVIQRIANPSVP